MDYGNCPTCGGTLTEKQADSIGLESYEAKRDYILKVLTVFIDEYALEFNTHVHTSALISDLESEVEESLSRGIHQ